MKFALLIASVLCMASSAHAQLAPGPQVKSTTGLEAWTVWKNERTSLLVVTTLDAGTGEFKGTFINNAPGYRCQGVPADMKGKLTGTDVWFVANFGPCANTITVWRGKVTGNTIPTEWLLKYVDNNGQWQEQTNKDTFTRQ